VSVAAEACGSTCPGVAPRLHAHPPTGGPCHA
jgi:hypothetical protein